MGKIKEEKRVKLFSAMMTNDEALFEKVENILKERFKEPDLASEVFPFDTTKYYNREFGEGLMKKFISFKELILEGELSRIKVFTNSVEERFLKNKNRRINIDPGYVGIGKVVLASTKDSYHRVYLKDGIYAEVVLYFNKGLFENLPWTYPDFKKEVYKDFFLDMRKKYLVALRN